MYSVKKQTKNIFVFCLIKLTNSSSMFYIHTSTVLHEHQS